MKRGIWILIIVLLSSLTLASIKVNLDQTTFGPDQNIEGNIELQLKEPMPLDSPVTITINNKHHTKNLSQIFELIEGEKTLPSSYKQTGAPSNQLALTFGTPSSKMVGINLATAGQRSDIQFINSFTMEIKGDKVNNKYPQSPSLDIGNDGTEEYIFIGDPILNDFEQIPSNYLADETVDLQTSLRGAQTDIACQKIKIKPSKKYKITTKTKKVKDGAELKATLMGLDEFPNCEDNNCCTLNPTSNINTKKSCTISKEITEEKEHYVCLFVDGGEGTETYYKIGQDADDTIQNGFYYTTQYPTKDYFIYLSWEKFKTELKNVKNVPDIHEPAQTYLYNCPSDDCLILPIKVSTKSPGKVTLQDLNLGIETMTGLRDLNNFLPITYQPERINYSEKFQIPLSFFEDALTPTSIKDDYLINAVIGTVSNPTTHEVSDAEKFDVKNVATVSLDYEPYNPTVGDLISFTASARPTDDKTVKAYEWDFGDGTTATGSTATHAFSEEKEYTVKVTVIDSEDLKSTRSTKINVQSLQATLEDKFNHTVNKLKTIKTNLPSLDPNIKSVYNTLGYTVLIDQAQGNLTLLKTRFESLDLTQPSANATLMEINRDLNSIQNSIPEKAATSKVTFSSKVTSLDQIPTAPSLGYESIESFQEKVFISQQAINIQSEATLIKLKFMSNKVETFMVVKKIITGTGTVYDILPSSLTMKQVLTPNYEIVSPAIYKFTGTNEIKYILNVPAGFEDTALTTSTDSKTLVLPLDLSTIQTTQTVTTPSYTGYCGDSICSSTEDKETCPDDCDRSTMPWGIIIILILLIGAGVYYFNFYNGPYNYTQLTGGKPNIRLFKSSKDYYSLVQYIQSARRKGLLAAQITTTLKKKGWKPNQIQEAFKFAKR